VASRGLTLQITIVTGEETAAMVVPEKSQESSPVQVARRPGPDSQEPTAAAEIHIELRSVDRPRLPAWLLWFIPAAIGLRLTVPAAESVPMLRMLERVTYAIAWPTGVIGTLFGAAAAHLPPIGTTILVALEIVVPALVLRGRRGRDVR
jgi:hypothetical protein